MRRVSSGLLKLDKSCLKPGLRVAVGLSGGADSVALLLALLAESRELGLLVSAAHLHHGLRGAEADADQEFCRALAEELEIPFHTTRINVGPAALANPVTGKDAEGIEEAARRLRYGWFRSLMAAGEVDAVATAHTMDDQAETVLIKLLRGAWTEGLSGIHPLVEFSEGRVVRPMLAVTRLEVERYLQENGQTWREDSSNREAVFTRNRVRHELLPVLEGWNPRLRENLARMAELARDEESYWKAQLTWLAPQLILPGSPVRGGGRAARGGVALEIGTLARQTVAMQRRILRYAVEDLGGTVDFYATEALRELALTGKAGQKRELLNGLLAERSHRELRLVFGTEEEATADAPVFATVPGVIEGFGFSLQVAARDSAQGEQTAVLRNWRPGDRVRPRYSSGPRKVKEVLERMRVSGSDRNCWPVLEIGGQIVWMKNLEVEPESGFQVFQQTEASDEQTS